MDYTDQFLRQVAEQKREDQEALEQAKKEAAEQGKEPFSLETLDRLWPSNPDFRPGFTPSRESRIKDWETVYYRRCPQIRTLAEFAESMQQAQLWGSFD